MAAGEQGHEHALEHPVLAGDDALDLEQGGFEALLGEAGALHGAKTAVGHIGSFGSLGARKLSAVKLRGA